MRWGESRRGCGADHGAGEDSTWACEEWTCAASVARTQFRVQTTPAGQLLPACPSTPSHLTLFLWPLSASRVPFSFPQSRPCSLGILTPRPILGQSG